jgi:hypothetical protein
MAMTSIANGIFKQLIFVPEAVNAAGISDLGTIATTSTTLFAYTGSIATTITAAGSDETTIVFPTVSTAGILPKGSTLTFSNSATKYYTAADVTIALGTSVSVTVTLTDSLTTALTAATGATLSVQNSPKAIVRMLRRVTSNIDLKKATYSSNEIRTDAQLADFRHGGVSVEGSINGELSGNTYQDLMGAVLRKDFKTSISKAITTGATIAATTVANTASGLAFTLTLQSLGDLTLSNSASDKLRTGDIVWFDGLGATYANNTYCPLIILNITLNATTAVLTLIPVVKPAAWTDITTGATLGIVNYEVLGKKSYIPLTGHTKRSFQFEHYYKDVSTAGALNASGVLASELFVGCRPTQMSIKLPSTGLATCDFTIMGQRMKTPTDYSQSFVGEKSLLENITTSTPLDSGVDPIFSAAVGSIYMRDKVGGTIQKVGLITSFDFTVNGNGSKADVVGSDQTPDIFLGKISVSGNLSIYFVDTTWRDVFYKEQEASLIAVFTSNSVGDNTTKCLSVVMPRIKTGGASKDDGDKGLIMTVPFTALLGDGTLGFEPTTLQIQDFS